MGNACGGASSPEQKVKAKKSRELDAFINGQANRTRDEVKLLLLGPGESGKSTIFKQMKILQQNGGFTPQELGPYRFIVFGNCITQMKVLVSAAEKLGIAISADNQAAAQRINDLPAGGDSWSRDIAQDIKMLWADNGIRETYEQRDRAFQLNDSSAYFFDDIDRIMQDNYVPTEQDWLRARVRSTGIEEAEFEFEDLSFRMLDVGGQRSERRKWIHCFDSVTAVIFCASLSEYDQTLREDDSQNRMKESLLLFDEICNSPWFRDTAFMLFLNKTDLFKEKIARVSLKTTFPEYDGGSDYDLGCKFIQKKFLEVNQASNSHKIFTHYTCAVNTENVRFVFKATRETLLREVLNEIF